MMKEMLDNWTKRWKNLKPTNEIDRATKAHIMLNILLLKIGSRE